MTKLLEINTGVFFDDMLSTTFDQNGIINEEKIWFIKRSCKTLLKDLIISLSFKIDL
jgi:hypothetical protein